VIASSGTATCDWAIVSRQEHYSKNLARVNGASSSEISDPAARVRFLRSVKASELVKKADDVLDAQVYSCPVLCKMVIYYVAFLTSFVSVQDYVYGMPRVYAFAPVVEPAGTRGAFLSDDPKELLSQGKFAQVPMMIGFNSLEGGALFFGK